MSNTLQPISADEQRVVTYFGRYGLVPERIAEAGEKRPDFLIEAQNKYCFFVEVKTWEPFPEDQGILWEQFYKRLRDDVRKAVRQFRMVNSTHSAGNVLCLVSHESRFCRFEDLQVAIKGRLILPGRPSNGRVSEFLCRQGFGRSVERPLNEDVRRWNFETT